MNKAKNVSAAVMAALIFVASLAFGGCDAGGEKGIGEKVPQGGKWYSVNKTTVGSQYIDKNDIESFESKYVGAADGFAVFYVEFQKSLPQGQDPMTADYNELQGRTLEIYGKDGSLADSVDLKSRIAESGIFKLDPKEYTELLKIIRTDADKDKTDEQVFEENGISVSWMPNQDFMIKDNVLSFSVQAVYPAKDGASWEQKTINISYDVKTKEFKTLGENERKEQLYVQGIYDLEGYNVLIGQSFMAGSQCIFEVTLPKERRLNISLTPCFRIRTSRISRLCFISETGRFFSLVNLLILQGPTGSMRWILIPGSVRSIWMMLLGLFMISIKRDMFPVQAMW